MGKENEIKLNSDILYLCKRSLKVLKLIQVLNFVWKYCQYIMSLGGAYILFNSLRDSIARN